MKVKLRLEAAAQVAVLNLLRLANLLEHFSAIWCMSAPQGACPVITSGRSLVLAEQAGEISHEGTPVERFEEEKEEEEEEEEACPLRRRNQSL